MAKIETMDDFENEIDKSFVIGSVGEVLNGTIISISEEEAVLDLGLYKEGVIPKSECSNDPEFDFLHEWSEGQVLSVKILDLDDGAGRILVSVKQAALLQGWKRIKEIYDNDEIINVQIREIVKSGVIAYVEEIKGFIPASLLGIVYVEDLTEWKNKSVDVKIESYNIEENKLVLSAKKVLVEQKEKEQKQQLDNIKIGAIVDAKVESLQPYGAFVRLSNGVSGLIHISQICEKRIKTPAQILKIGEEVKAKVISNKDGKLGLSIRALEDVFEKEEEVFEIEESEEIGTNLGSLFKNIKL